jgi:hypothetical protein
MDRLPIRIRWSELRLAALCALVFGLAVRLFLPGMWPLMPFPATGPVELAALLGFLFGLIVRRGWVLALPLTALVALDPPKSGVAGGVIVLLVVWPFAAAGGALGIGAGKALQRRMLRSTLRAARRREHATKTPAPPVHVSVAGR